VPPSLQRPSISVIVPARNEAEPIAACLQGLLSQDIALAFEIVVVDSGSSGATGRVSGLPVRLVHAPGPGRPAALNAGIRAAHGDILAFTGADCVPRTDWLRMLLAGADDPECGCLIGEFAPDGPADAVATFVRDANLMCQRHMLSLAPPAASAANIAYRRDVFDTVGAFDEAFEIGEDRDMFWRMVRCERFRYRYNSGAVVARPHPAGLRDFMASSFRDGAGLGRFRRKHAADHPVSLSSAAHGAAYLAKSVAGVLACPSRIMREVASHGISPQRALKNELYRKIGAICRLGGSLYDHLRGHSFPTPVPDRQAGATVLTPRNGAQQTGLTDNLASRPARRGTHQAKRPPAGIRFIGACDNSGYGTASRRLLHGLKNAGVPFSWTPMVAGDGLGLGYEPLRGRTTGDAELDPFVGRDIPYDTVFLHLMPEYVPFFREAEPDKRFILHTAWETDRIPHHWRFLLELADRVAVPSTWNRDVFLEAGLRVPVDVLPHAAVTAAPVQGPPPAAIREGDYVFLAVDTWTARKRLRETIQCYLDTFTADDAVTLVVKTDGRNHMSPWPMFTSTALETRLLLRRYRNPARVVLVTGRLSDDDMARLHTRADCYLSLSHGEGWGLGAFDAATRGKPVVATGFGGPLDYLPPDDAYLVRSRLVPVRNDLGKPSFTDDQQWAEPDSAHAGQLIRHVFTRRDEASERGLRLQTRILEEFSEQAVVERFMRLIEASPRNDTGDPTA
jgi:glycosyltransferase involved in cell wall biosynthesis